MTNKDYTKFSKNHSDDYDISTSNPIQEVSWSVTEDDTLEEPIANSTPEPITESELIEQKPLIFGKVVDCQKLNVRQYPNPFADVLGHLVNNTEIEIDEDKSTNDFYAICTPAGLEGFCLKKFVEIRK